MKWTTLRSVKWTTWVAVVLAAVALFLVIRLVTVLVNGLDQAGATLIQAFATFSVGASAGAIGYLNYLQQRQQKVVNWYRLFRKYHAKFWSRVFAEARRYIACDEAYKKVKLVFEKRNSEWMTPAELDARSSEAKEPLTEAEYEIIDQMDRFCAIMLRVKHVNESPPRKKADLDERTRMEIENYDKWWFDRLEKGNRPDLWQYISKTWPEIGLKK